jgi:hypothetical protein
MAVEAQVCPQCGAPIQFAAGQSELVCPHCGTTVRRPAEPSLAEKIEQQKLVQATMQLKMRLHSGGRPALAQVTDAKQTGILVHGLNGEGMLLLVKLEVQPAGEAPFAAEAGAMVSLAGLENWQPGLLLDVHYDPQDRTQVSVEGRHGVKNYPGEPDRKT